jgi:hypothetical protein
MSVMEKRLQLLLDADRFRLVHSEATRSGRSVAAVIREAIDYRFSGTDERSAGLQAFLDLTEQPAGAGLDWATIKSSLDDDLSAGVVR